MARKTEVPQSVAIIMDGNRRWARARGLPKEAGHRAGYQAFKRIVRAAQQAGIHTLIVDAFALKNWQRDEREVSALMQLFARALEEAEAEFAGEGVRFRFIGNSSYLSKPLVKTMRRLEDETRNRTGLQLVLAISYGGRDDIRRMVQCFVDKAAREGSFAVTEELVSDYLATGVDISDPDLVIRTSGEQRLSDFLPWESTDSEFIFAAKCWPDFTEDDLHGALAEYARRERRRGR